METFKIRMKAFFSFLSYISIATIVFGIINSIMFEVLIDAPDGFFSIGQFVLSSLLMGYFMGGMAWMILTWPSPEALNATPMMRLPRWAHNMRPLFWWTAMVLAANTAVSWSPELRQEVTVITTLVFLASGFGLGMRNAFGEKRAIATTRARLATKVKTEFVNFYQGVAAQNIITMRLRSDIEALLTCLIDGRNGDAYRQRLFVWRFVAEETVSDGVVFLPWIMIVYDLAAPDIDFDAERLEARIADLIANRGE